MFNKDCIKSNKQLSLSQLMHNVDSGGAVFLCQVLERRTAQDAFNTSIMYTAERNIYDSEEVILNILKNNINKNDKHGHCY